MLRRTVQGSFNPATDIPSLAGKVILITGGNHGVGKQTALDLARYGRPARIWIAARNAQRNAAAVAEIQKASPAGVQIRSVELDLASFESVKAAARTFTAAESRLDILILNAGLMGGPVAVTPDGYENTFATNHMGHALLLKLLMPTLLRTASGDGDAGGSDVRVVFLSSKGHGFALAPGLAFDTFKDAQSRLPMIHRYIQSKLANVMYAREVARRYATASSSSSKSRPKGITAVSINPGDVNTGLYSSGNLGLKMNVLSAVLLPLIGISVEEGAKNSLWAATSPDVVSGEYYEPVGVAGKASAFSQNAEMAAKLWDWTQKELEGHDI
ncbi:hypothetical protein BX600DRAFT_375194 [Xylariales sp. PMI_506]|nr:hypothetical protein BX600DRAFT_375194 [Xylariales sp. PMI_506]